MKIGLALGGSGARGLAHIPMLEAFDELGLKPAMIAGCSMGALVGAAYAGGMSGKELRDHALSLLSNRMAMARHVFGAKGGRFGNILSIKGLTSMQLEGRKLADIALPSHLPQQMEDHAIPLKIIVTDYERMEEVVLQSGHVHEAVGASIAIPGLISAPLINGRIHVDGGVKNPVPFNHVTQGMDLVVAIDVTGRPRPPRNSHPSNLELAIGSVLILFHELADLRREHMPPDIYITPDIDLFNSGDFFKAKEIFLASEPAKERLKRALDFESQCKSLAAALEEFYEHRLGLAFTNAAIDFGRVMAGGLGKKPWPMFHGSHLFIACAKINAAQSGEGNGCGTHGARLQGHIEITIYEPLAAQNLRRRADGQKLGMGGGIFEFERPVPRLGQHFSIGIDNDRAHGNFATGCRCLGFRKGNNHGLWQFLFHSGRSSGQRVRGQAEICALSAEDSEDARSRGQQAAPPGPRPTGCANPFSTFWLMALPILRWTMRV